MDFFEVLQQQGSGFQITYFKYRLKLCMHHFNITINLFCSYWPFFIGHLAKYNLLCLLFTIMPIFYLVRLRGSARQPITFATSIESSFCGNYEIKHWSKKITLIQLWNELKITRIIQLPYAFGDNRIACVLFAMENVA